MCIFQFSSHICLTFHVVTIYWVGEKISNTSKLTCFTHATKYSEDYVSFNTNYKFSSHISLTFGIVTIKWSLVRQKFIYSQRHLFSTDQREYYASLNLYFQIFSHFSEFLYIDITIKLAIIRQNTINIPKTPVLFMRQAH